MSDKKLIMPDPDFFIDKEAFPEVPPAEVLFTFFQWMRANPYWGTSAGEPVIMITGKCHHSHSGTYSVFCNTKGICHCFSLCGDSFRWYVYAARIWEVSVPEAKEKIKLWLDHTFGTVQDFQQDEDYEYVQMPFQPDHIKPLPYIGGGLVNKWYKRFDQSIKTMSKLIWHTQEHIKVSTMLNYGVAYYPERGTIILPHHNIKGEIVGMYERSFAPLRKDIKKEHPEYNWQQLQDLPVAKYKPLYDPELKKSLSFKNSHNLYGLFRSKQKIKETGKAIVVEGGKSVMLLDQWGYKNAVAPHTFGISEPHISMLIEAGAKEIILGFDKQYQSRDSYEWELYKQKNLRVAERVGNYVDISVISDPEDLLEYKDAPVDKGEEIFEYLLENREKLT